MLKIAVCIQNSEYADVLASIKQEGYIIKFKDTTNVGSVSTWLPLTFAALQPL